MTGASTKRPRGATRPTGVQRPLALACQEQLSSHIEEGEDKDDDEGAVLGTTSDDELKELLKHLELEHFESAIHRAGVLSVAQMASVADSILMSPSVGLRKVHIRKLREESRTLVLAARQNCLNEVAESSSSGISENGCNIHVQSSNQNTTA